MLGYVLYRANLRELASVVSPARWGSLVAAGLLAIAGVALRLASSSRFRLSCPPSCSSPPSAGWAWPRPPILWCTAVAVEDTAATPMRQAQSGVQTLLSGLYGGLLYAIEDTRELQSPSQKRDELQKHRRFPMRSVAP